MSSEEIAKINSSKLLVGLDPAEHQYWTRLIKQSASKIHLSEESEFSLGKRLAQMDELSEVQGEKKLSGARQSLGFKAEFAKEFISNSRSQAAEKSQPNVLKIGINDFYGLVTVVETNPLMKVILVGTAKGEITCVFLQKSTQCYEEDTERMRVEQNERDRENQNAAAEGEQAVNEEFRYDLNSLIFSGHSSPITAISLKYDSRRFVSGSLDGEIRLWDVQLQECIAVFKEHFEAVFTLKMAPKGDLFASSGSEAIIYLWSEASSSPGSRRVARAESRRTPLRRVPHRVLLQHALPGQLGHGLHAPGLGPRGRRVQAGHQVPELRQHLHPQPQRRPRRRRLRQQRPLLRQP